MHNTFEEDVSRFQNCYRRRHNVPFLELNTTLSEMARNWARKIAENDTIKASNIGNGTYVGENLCVACGFDFTGYDVTLEW
jgi:uncharacterized protein YkwD